MLISVPTVYPKKHHLSQLASDKGSLSFKGPEDKEPTGRITTNSTPSHTLPTVSSSVNLLSVSTCLGLTEVVGHWKKWVKTEDKFPQLGKWEMRKPRHFPNVSLCSAEKWDPDPHGRCTPHLWGVLEMPNCVERGPWYPNSDNTAFQTGKAASAFPGTPHDPSLISQQLGQLC